MPHYCSGAVVVSYAGGPTTLDGLKGKTVGAQVSSIYPNFLAKIPGIKEVKSYPTDLDALQALIGKKVDATVTDQFVVMEAMKKTPGLNSGNLINPERNASAVAKGNQALHDALEKSLQTLMKNGFYKKLSQKYFARDIRCK